VVFSLRVRPKNFFTFHVVADLFLECESWLIYFVTELMTREFLGVLRSSKLGWRRNFFGGQGLVADAAFISGFYVGRLLDGKESRLLWLERG